ncbi:hypothetical protein COLO4_16672, partial [Corchorus olitorius]
MNGLTINQLYPSRLRQTIRLRVTRVWDCIVPATGKCLGIAFVASDHSQKTTLATLQTETNFWQMLLEFFSTSPQFMPYISLVEQSQERKISSYAPY